jgi:hypothetical protein
VAAQAAQDAAATRAARQVRTQTRSSACDHVYVGKRYNVEEQNFLGTGLAIKVVVGVSPSAGVENGLDPATEARGGFRRRGPWRLERFEIGRRVDFINAAGSRRRRVPRRDRIGALTHHALGFVAGLAGVGEGDGWEAAETHFATLSIPVEEERPAPAHGRAIAVDHKIKRAACRAASLFRALAILSA